jgi:hypothetical protein
MAWKDAAQTNSAKICIMYVCMRVRVACMLSHFCQTATEVHCS